MNLFSLLADYQLSILPSGFSIGMGWLGQLIRGLIEGIGITGVGIIVFTLILRAITLPFDIYQRVKMRKQTLIMKNMAPDLEKLQKQYANDKDMYNRKMLELYKKNGYSMLGACLPMIISLVILIVAFNSLNTYSQYANLSMYERMVSAYNTEILSYSISEADAAEDEIEVTTNQDGVYVYIRSKADDKFIYRRYNRDVTDNRFEESRKYEYFIDIEKCYAYAKDEIDGLLQAHQDESGYTRESACIEYVKLLGGQKAAETYRNDPPSFLWIKNIWYSDVSYNHPIQDYNSFIGSIRSKVTLTENKLKMGEDKEPVLGEDGKPVFETVYSETDLSNVIDEATYNDITSCLLDEKQAPNGYFVLIVLSIGLMFLSQFISMKSNKESNQYQTVDGSGMGQQKIMMILMPLIYAVFAFMYSAAFSIYMVMSSVLSILVTVISNIVIGRIFAKQEEKQLIEKLAKRSPTYDAKRNRKK